MWYNAFVKKRYIVAGIVSLGLMALVYFGVPLILDRDTRVVQRADEASPTFYTSTPEQFYGNKPTTQATETPTGVAGESAVSSYTPSHSSDPVIEPYVYVPVCHNYMSQNLNSYMMSVKQTATEKYQSELYYWNYHYPDIPADTEEMLARGNLYISSTLDAKNAEYAEKYNCPPLENTFSL